MTIQNTSKILASLIPLMESTGSYQLERFRTREPGWGDEKAEREFVSEVDIESEHRLKEGLLRILPAAFFGEETERSRAEFTWVVDPLDGTSNYLSGLDIWAVSVALLRGDEVVLGAVHKPPTKETFTAERGGGAFHDGKRIGRKKEFRLEDALVSTGFPYRSPDTTASFFRSVEELLLRCRDIRRPGSAALDLAYVAAGYMQGFWEIDLQPYDVAAGLLLLEETGCRYSTIKGEPYDPFSCRSLVIGLPGLMEELRAILARHYDVD